MIGCLPALNIYMGFPPNVPFSNNKPISQNQYRNFIYIQKKPPGVIACHNRLLNASDWGGLPRSLRTEGLLDPGLWYIYPLLAADASQR